MKALALISANGTKFQNSKNNGHDAMWSRRTHYIVQNWFEELAEGLGFVRFTAQSRTGHHLDIMMPDR